MHQITIFDISPIPNFKAGDTVEDTAHVGKQLSWEEAKSMIGQMLWLKHKLQSMTYYEALIVEELVNLERNYPYPERLICFDGCKQRSLIDQYSYGDRSNWEEWFYEMV